MPLGISLWDSLPFNTGIPTGSGGAADGSPSFQEWWTGICGPITPYAGLSREQEMAMLEEKLKQIRKRLPELKKEQIEGRNLRNRWKPRRPDRS